MESDIKHVVVLMLENHSFDEMLGYMQTRGFDVDGVNPKAFRFNFGRGNPASRIHPAPKTAYVTNPDPHHEHLNVMNQLQINNGGFVSEYFGSYPNATDEQAALVMGYYEHGSLPALHTLAESFLVCDRWFSSLPGPTWPNRLFIHSGTSNGYVTMPTCLSDVQLNFHRYDQPTIYQRLQEKGIPWKIYHHGMPQSLVLQKQQALRHHYDPMSNFFSDAAGAESAFPGYSFIEPAYMLEEQNDQHPPSDIRKGDKLIADIYNALRANEALWNKALFVVVYDEHGGFYDHVKPPVAEPADEHTNEFSFAQYGLRVPAVLISPWLDAGTSHTVFDHTSILKYVIEKWSLGPLTRRVEKAVSLGSLFGSRTAPRTDTPKSIDYPLPTYAESLAKEHLDFHDQAWIAFAADLERLMLGHVVATAQGSVMSAFESTIPVQEKLAVAREKVALFLSKGRADGATA